MRTTFLHRMGIAGLFGALSLVAFAGTAHAEGWVELASPTSQSLFGVDCAQSNSCIAVGDAGTIVHTTDRDTWSAVSSGTSYLLNDVDAYSTSLAFAVGEHGTILKSTNNGATWTSMASGTTETLHDVQIASASVAWAVGDSNIVLKTIDGGTTWNDVSTMTIEARAIDSISTSVVWVAGLQGLVFRSTDGGVTWTDVSAAIPATTDLVTIDVVASTRAYVGGEGRYFAATADSGSTWTVTSGGSMAGFSTSEYVADIAFISTSVGHVVGNEGSPVYITGSGATVAEDRYSFPTVPIYDISFSSSTSGFVVGNGGLIAIYDNFGPAAPTNIELDGGAYTNDTTPSFAWTSAEDMHGEIIRHELSIDGGNTWVVADSNSDHIWLDELSEGEYMLQVRGIDDVENEGEIEEYVFAIDRTSPVISSVTPLTATVGTPVSFSVDVADALSAIDACSLTIDSSSLKVMTQDSTNAWIYEHTFTSAGTYSAYATCIDAAGNEDTGNAVDITVSEASAATTTTTTTTTTTSATTTTADTTAPSVGSLTPTTAVEDDQTTIRVAVSDAGGLDYCRLYINSTLIGSMTIAGSYATYEYMFTSSGTKTGNAYCVDEAGNATRGATTSIVVSAASSEEDEAVSEASEGSLLKMACPGGEDASDPCRAVYYYGQDGKRHAFPNENVFFSWYLDFDDIVIVTDAYMASLAFGHNVTYHPGSSLVKFLSVNTVYAVGEEGELRAIDSEDTARSIFGSSWSQQVEDISDAFFTNYSFGDDIEATNDYDEDEAYDAVDSIDDIL